MKRPPTPAQWRRAQWRHVLLILAIIGGPNGVAMAEVVELPPIIVTEADADPDEAANEEAPAPPARRILVPEFGTVFRAHDQQLFTQAIQGQWSVEGISGGQLTYRYEGISLNAPWNPNRELGPAPVSAFAAELGAQEFAYGPAVDLRAPRAATRDQAQARADYFASVGTGSLVAAGFRFADAKQGIGIAATSDARLSQADRALSGNSESDAKLAVNVQYRRQVGQTEWGLLYIEDRHDLDFGGGANGDDFNYSGQTGTLVGYARRGHSTLGYTRFSADARNLPDAVHPQDLTTRYRSHGVPLDASLIRWTPSDSFTHELRLGAQLEFGDAQEHIDGTATNTGNRRLQTLKPEWRGDWRGGHYGLSAAVGEVLHAATVDGLLHDQRWSPQLRLVVTRGVNARRRSEYEFQRALRVPGLYELYSAYGDPALRTESAWALKLSETFAWGAWDFRAGIFYRELRDAIDFDLTSFRYANSARARLWGGTLRAARPLGAGSEFSLAIHGLGTRDQVNLPWLRRAPWSADAALRVRGVGGTWEIQQRWLAARPDVDPQSFARVRAPHFFATSLTYVRRLVKLLPEPVELVVRLDNPFDSRREEVVGYESLRRHVSLGLRRPLE